MGVTLMKPTLITEILLKNNTSPLKEFFFIELIVQSLIKKELKTQNPRSRKYFIIEKQ